MARQVTLDEAQIHLPNLVEAVKKGETIIIKENDQPVVQLVAVPPAQRRAKFGSAASLLVVAGDFDAPLLDLNEYMR